MKNNSNTMVSITFEVDLATLTAREAESILLYKHLDESLAQGFRESAGPFLAQYTPRELLHLMRQYKRFGSIFKWGKK